MKHVLKLVPMVLLVVLLLCACGAPEVPPTEPPVYYTVSYLVGSDVYTTQTVEQGQFPAPVTVQITGLEFTGWMDGSKQIVDPVTVPVNGNISYVAQGMPQLIRHMPYLEIDEYGFLRPEELLTAQELEFALKALTEEATWTFLPELPASNNVTGQQLKAVLGNFYAEDVLAAAVTCADTDAVTRAMFATYMHQLLGRSDEETFILGAADQVPTDVTSLRQDKVALLEACMRHTTDEAGQSWADIELLTGWDPGLHMEDGWLYYVQEDGQLLRGGQVDHLQFGADGRYTSGDLELDALVAGILKTIMEENPDLEGLDLLRKVYDHCHQDYKYLRKDAYLFGQTGWEVKDAKDMITKGRGNCYNFAAIFWALAKAMGYDVVCLSGTCTGTDQPHGWVGLYYEGTRYFVDPEWQYAYTEREIFDKDMFMLTMDEVWWWTYKWDESQF